MGKSRYKIYRENYPHFITITFVQWLPLISFPKVVQIIIDALNYLMDNHELTIYGWVFMENHIHLILKAPELSKVIHSFKSYTARQIIDFLKSLHANETLNELFWGKTNHKQSQTYQLWQEGVHPQEIQSREMMEQKMNYIHNNPIKRGYVEKNEHWRYSSAGSYLGREGLLTVCTKW